MQRRRVLQMGAVLVTLPVVGCGASAVDPAATPGTAPSEAKGAEGAATPPPVEAPAASVAPHAERPAAEGSAADASSSAAHPMPDLSRVIAKLGKNHGHVLTIAFADVQAGAEKTYGIAGSAGHPHTVALSADQMKTLQGGSILRTTSTTDKGHAHRVLVRCAPAVDPPEWVTACEATFSGKDEHELVIPAADVAAKADHTYDVQGIAGHAHELTISASDFQKLAKGEPVSLKTTRDPNDAHLHVVFIEYRPKSKSKPT